MRILYLALALSVAVWSGLAIASYNGPAGSDAAELEIRCRYGLCEDRDMATLARLRAFQTGVTQDPKLILNLLRQSPSSPELWCDLAEAYREQNQFAEGRVAFEHAVTLAPNSPPVLVRAAAALLIDGNRDEALPLFRRIFDKAPDYPGDNIFLLCSRFGISYPTMLATLLPSDQPKVGAQYLRFVMRSNRLSDATAAWNWIASHGLTSPPLVSDYAAFLLKQRQYAASFQAWSAARPYDKGNRVYNPGFESPLTSDPGPFDWRVQPSPVSIGEDKAERHTGATSLRLAFDGRENVSFQHVSQQLVLDPGVYTLSYWVKTKGVTTDQGVRLSVQDVEHPGGFQWTSDQTLLGEHPWTRLTDTVTIPPGSPLVRVFVLRNPSSKIESRIKGTVWLDDFEVSRLR